MSDAELLAEHIRSCEYLLQYGTLTEADRTVARARLMVVVGKLRQSIGRSDEANSAESR